MRQFPCTIMRGGTSKAVVFLEDDMPEDRGCWSDFLVDVMGSPDKRQIDGLGGANSLTSKTAIIGKSDREGFDVDYTFAQVSLDQGLADFKGNCGNISSAVAPFAVLKGLVEARDPVTSVSVYNTNTGKKLVSRVEVNGGLYVPDGDCVIPGVPGSGSPIHMSFYRPDGSVTGKILPTGRVSEVIETSRGSVRVSIVDSSNPLIFVKAEDVGLLGTELHTMFTEDQLGYLEEIRSIGAELCGFCKRDEATKVSPAIPKMTVLSEPKFYRDSSGTDCRADDFDVLIRMMSMQKPHQALAITGAVCTATALNMAGTVASDILGRDEKADGAIRLGHPGGIMDVSYKESKQDGLSVTVLRTARCLMDGIVYTKRDY